jgi:hypothetical protein
MKNTFTGVLLCLFAAGAVAMAADDWRDVAELRAHSIEVTARVEQVTDTGRHRDALLAVPVTGGRSEQTTLEMGPHSTVAEGDALQVTCDPARPDLVQEGWDIDYATPIIATLVAAGIVVMALLVILRGRIRRSGGESAWR